MSQVNKSGYAIRATVSVGATPDDICYAAGYLWVGNRGTNTVSKIDPRSGNVVATITVAAGPVAIIYAAGYVWVAGLTAGAGVSRIDPSTNACTVKFIDLGGAATCVGLAYDGSALWVATNSTFVKKVDLTGAVIATVALSGTASAAGGLLSVGGFLWVACGGGSPGLQKIDTSTNAVVATAAVGSAPLCFTSDGTYLWVTNYTGSSVSRVRLSDAAVMATITAGIGTRPVRPLYLNGRVYVGNRDAAGTTISVIDAASDVVVDTIRGLTAPAGNAWDGMHLWCPSFDASNKVNAIAVGRKPNMGQNLVKESETFASWFRQSVSAPVSGTFTATGTTAYTSSVTASAGTVHTLRVRIKKGNSFTLSASVDSNGVCVCFDGTTGAALGTGSLGTPLTILSSGCVTSADDSTCWDVYITVSSLPVTTAIVASIILNKSKVLVWGWAASSVIGDTLTVVRAQVVQGVQPFDYVQTFATATPWGAPRSLIT